jgi:hypothetical protein
MIVCFYRVYFFTHYHYYYYYTLFLSQWHSPIIQSVYNMLFGIFGTKCTWIFFAIVLGIVTSRNNCACALVG